MKRSRGFAASVFALVLAGFPLSSRAGLTPGIGAGTEGVTFTLGTPIGARYDARIQYGTFDYGTSVSSSDNSYQGQLHLQSFFLLGDYHPFGSTFALAAGLCFPHFSMAASAVPNADGSFTLNNTTFTGINTVGGNVAWERTSPYFGIAWVPTRERRGLSFAADLGAAFIGSPQVNISATGAGASNPLVQSAIAAEIQSLQSATNFRVYPVVNLGLVYRFGAHPPDEQAPTPEPTRPPVKNGNEFSPN